MIAQGRKELIKLLGVELFKGPTDEACLQGSFCRFSSHVILSKNTTGLFPAELKKGILPLVLVRSLFGNAVRLATLHLLEFRIVNYQ